MTHAKWLAVVAVALAVSLTAFAQEAPAPLDDSNSWAFTPPPDKFSPDAQLDLRSLNEKVAGEKGFVQLSADGSGFVLGDGTPGRFWAVNVNAGMKPEQIDEQCRALAKLGVNLVRISINVCDTREGAAITDVDAQAIDQAQRLVAAAKKCGIYTFIAPYRGGGNAPKSWGLEDTTSKWGLLLFNPKLQDAYKAWMKELLTRPNPYDDGVPLAKEPALAVVQLQDGDGLFWWTTQGLRGAQLRMLEKQFGDWCVKKYGSLDDAYDAWDGFGQVDDDFDAGVVALVNSSSSVWEMTQYQYDGAAKRLDDETAFFAQRQHDSYADAAAYLRDTLGCGQLVDACNYRTVDALLLEDVERWTYTAGDIVSENRSCGVSGGRVRPGQTFTNRPVVLDPTSFPGADKQVVGHPFVLTEAAWQDPGRYRTEGPFLASVYSSMTGVDTFIWSGAGGVDPRMWPANALALRKGYVEAAKTAVVHEERAFADMWARKVPIISETGAYDPDRDASAFGDASPIKRQIDPLAFLVGPVEVKYGGDPAKNRAIDLSPYLDKDAGVVRSVTGQIALNFKAGVCTVDSPRYQGVAGFLKAGGGKYNLGRVSIISTNEYAAVSVVPMDGEPLATSRSVLVQVGTVSRPTGWRVEAAGNGSRIVSTGGPPLRVANTEVTLTIADPNLTKAVLLDASGYAVKDVPVSATDGKLTVKLPAEAMYVMLR